MLAATRALTFVLMMPALLLPARNVLGATVHDSGYTVSRTASGIRLTLHLQRRSYPRHALVHVTAVLLNTSHRDLYTEPSRPVGFCSWPVVSLFSVKANGRSAEPVPPIDYPLPSCPFPGTVELPVGSSVVEQQLVELWSGRLASQAQVFNHIGGGYQGFTFTGPIARLRLRTFPSPRITVNGSHAVVHRPPGASGPLYYRSWGTCETSEMHDIIRWISTPGNLITSSCGRPVKWHIDAGWLNSPVTTINFGANVLRDAPSL